MKTSFFLAVLLLGMGVCAEEGKDPVELRMWNLPENPPPNPPLAAELKILQNFEKSHPSIKIVPGGGPQLQKFGRGTREFLMAQAGGIAPDVVEMLEENLQIFISKNFLLPLDTYLAEAGLLEHFRKSTFATHFQRDGKIFALPTNSLPLGYVLCYRKDLFEQAGLDPERPPRTWDEFLDYAEKLTDPSRNVYGFAIPRQISSSIQSGGGIFVELMMALNGVEIICKNEDGEWIADFADDKRAIQVAEFIKELLGRKISRAGREYTGIATTSAGWVNDAEMLANGRAAMIIQGIHAVPWHRARDLSIRHTGLAVLPLGPSGDGFVPIVPMPLARGYTYLGVNAACQDPKRIEAALEWIKYRASKECNNTWVKTYVDWDWQEYVDPRMVAENEELAGDERRVPQQWEKVWKTYTQNGRALPMCSPHRQLRQEYLFRIAWSFMDNPDQDVRALLKDVQQGINSNLLRSTSPEVKASRRNKALAVVVGISVIFLGAMFFALRGFGRRKESLQSQGTIFQAGRKRIYLIAALLMLPAVGSVILWMYLPLVRGAMIAFQDYQLLGETKWVGLDNFIEVLTDGKFWISLLRTIQYGLISLSLGFVAPIFLALLLFEVPRGKVLFRVLFYLPALTSGLVIMFLWKWFYNPTAYGPLNIIIAEFGAIFGMELGPYKWLMSSDLAMISVILPTIWAGIGPGSIIYLAALHGVPDDLYEAAELDGAGVWSKIWNVSLPYMRPLIFINFLGAFIATFHTMQNVFVMTQGGPGDATYLTGLYIFFNAFFWLDFGKATAAAWILGSLLIGFTVYQLRVLKRMKFQAGASVGE